MVSDSYPFDKQFERAVVGLLVTSDRFFNRVGPHLDPAKFRDRKAQLIAAECRSLYEQIGKAPGSEMVIFQRLRVIHEKGKLNISTLEKCAEYICDAMDAGLPDPDVAIHQVADVLKRVKGQEALDRAFTTYAERGDMREVAKELDAVENIGRNDASYGATLDGFDQELDQLGHIVRLPTGFRDLDVASGGGSAQGEAFFWLAGPKIGKTMALVQNTVIGLLRGLHVGVATLEVDVVKWRARVLGVLTGTPYQDILRHGSKSVAFERYRAMVEDPEIQCGRLSINKFGGHQTKFAEVADWVKREEDRSGLGVQLLVVDYADKLCGRNDRDGMYEQMRDVYEAFRIWCETNKAWGWTASQAVRIALGEMPTVNHCADSQHKVRIMDGMVGITRLPDEENKVKAKFLALRSTMGEGAEAGPLPNGFDYGCFVKSCAYGVEVEEALKQGEGDPLDVIP